MTLANIFYNLPAYHLGMFLKSRIELISQFRRDFIAHMYELAERWIIERV